MIKRVMGNTGMEVSALGFGGAEIGFENADPAAVERLLGAALDAGLNVIDTAECYRAVKDGQEIAASEDLIGRAVAGRRNDFYLFTKVGHAAGLDGDDWDPAMMAASIDRSLKRLRVDHVDLIQLHTCSEDKLRQGDVIDVLRKARDAGKTRFIGYSGDSTTALYAVESGAFDTLQTSVNIADQECVTLTLPKAKERGMGVIAKRPVANVAWRSGSEPPTNAYYQTYWERLGKLGYDFLNGPDAVKTALLFTLSAPGVHTAIVGTAKPERWGQNAALVGDGALPPDVWKAIRDRWAEIAGPDWKGQG
jgi:aryl-alcohol dehydrogenase-like predicted oxidoreductase